MCGGGGARASVASDTESIPIQKKKNLQKKEDVKNVKKKENQQLSWLVEHVTTVRVHVCYMRRHVCLMPSTYEKHGCV